MPKLSSAMSSRWVASYTDLEGRNHFDQWFASLEGKPAHKFVLNRLCRIGGGHLGDSHYVRLANSRAQPVLTEIRINARPGIRLYGYTNKRGQLILLTGGTKNTQLSDIRLATRLLKESQRRNLDR